MQPIPYQDTGVFWPYQKMLRRAIIIHEPATGSLDAFASDIGKGLEMCMELMYDIPDAQRNVQIFCSHKTASLDTATGIQELISKTWTDAKVRTQILIECLYCDSGTDSRSEENDIRGIRGRLEFSLENLLRFISNDVPSIAIIVTDKEHAARLPHRIAPSHVCEEQLRVPAESMVLVNIQEETAIIISGERFHGVRKIPNPNAGPSSS